MAVLMLLLQVQKPHALDVALAHVVAPVSSAAKAPDAWRRAGEKQGARSVDGAAGSALIVALDAEGVLAEMQVMGAGLVEEALVKEHPSVASNQLGS